MAARRPRHRRWFVHRRRFRDAQGGQVTDTWLNIPLLPRRVRTWRSPDRRVGVTSVRFSFSPVGCGAFLVVLLLGTLVAVFHDVETGQWVARIPDYLMALAGLGILTVVTWRTWRATHRPE